MKIHISYDFLNNINSVYYNYTNCHTIVIDVLRASTTINTLLEFNNEIYVTETKNLFNDEYDEGFIKFGEKNGKKITNCSYGNSPIEVKLNKEEITNKLNNSNNKILMATTNGTRVLNSIISNDDIFIGSITNSAYIGEYVFNLAYKNNKDIVIIPVHRKGEFAIEDYIGGGLIIKSILKQCNIHNIVVNTEPLIPALNLIKGDWKKEILKSNSAENLKKLGHIEDILFCISENTQKIVGKYRNGKITNVL